MSHPDLTAMAPVNGADCETRIAAAFNVKAWNHDNMGDPREVLYATSERGFEIAWWWGDDALEVQASYPLEQVGQGRWRSDCVMWDGKAPGVFHRVPTACPEPNYEPLVAELARGLTLLGFEIPGVSAHERLEWMLEMKARGFEVPKTL